MLDSVHEKMTQGYETSLTHEELLTSLLESGILARRLLEAYEDLRQLEQASLSELLQIRGMNEKKACRLKAAFSFGRKVCSVPWEKGTSYNSPDLVVNHYRPILEGLKKEQFRVIALDSRNRKIRDFVISEGTLTSCPVHPREVFQPLIRESAASAIVIHNHPSGETKASIEDIQLTNRLVEAGDLLGIRILDHIIIGRYEFTSLKQEGHI